MPNLTPPQLPLTWGHTPKEVTDSIKGFIVQDKETYDKVGSLPQDMCNFESLAIALADAEMEALTMPLEFYQHVAESKELRDAANNAEMLLADHTTDMNMHFSVYQAMINAEKNIKTSGRVLTPEEARLVEKSMLDAKRAGLDLAKEKREELEKLQKEEQKAVANFISNINEDKSYVTFTYEELKGIPEDVISRYTKEDGRGTTYEVKFKDQQFDPLLEFAENPETRRKVYQEFENRLAELNLPLLKGILDKRRQIAKLLGYETWVDYCTEVCMVQKADRVRTFLDEMREKLHPVGLEECQTLLGLKKKEHLEKGYPLDEKLYIWDYRYYKQKLMLSLGLDKNLVKEYFPVSVIVPKIIKIYQELLSIEFVEMKGKGESWHKDVQKYSVWKKDAKTPEDFIGYCYLDLLTRENKCPSAAVTVLNPGYLKPDGKRHYPAVAIVMDLATKAQEFELVTHEGTELVTHEGTELVTHEDTELVTHEDAVTFFHEFGHVVHGLLSRTRFAKFHGTRVAMDFVETPSQMLEYWVWEPKVLKRISKHYKTGDPLPPDLIAKLVESRNFITGLEKLIHLFFAEYDYRVHTEQESVPINDENLWDKLRKEIALFDLPCVPCRGQGRFDHIQGYGGTYYSYLYSRAFAADMYATVFKENPLSSLSGEKYKESILVPGGSRDEIDSLKEFLGRKPDAEAFRRELSGSQVPASTE